MPAKLTLHPPQRASQLRPIREGQPVHVGRDESCEVSVADGRVSKRHARILWTGAEWRIEDLRSKNGTTLNGSPVPAAGARLDDGDWLSFGGLLGRFEHASAEGLRLLEQDRRERLSTSVELRRRLSAELGSAELLRSFLESAMRLVGAERGFVLVAGPDGGLVPEVASGFSSGDLDPAAGFSGSRGAVEQALRSGGSIVVSDAQKHPLLGKRPSVVEGGLGALAAIPLVHDARLRGLLYVDAPRPGGFEQLDLEILESLAEHVSLVLSAVEVERRLQSLARRPAPEAPLLEVLQRRLTGLPGTPSSRS